MKLKRFQPLSTPISSKRTLNKWRKVRVNHRPFMRKRRNQGKKKQLIENHRRKKCRKWIRKK